MATIGSDNQSLAGASAQAFFERLMRKDFEQAASMVASDVLGEFERWSRDVNRARFVITGTSPQGADKLSSGVELLAEHWERNLIWDVLAPPGYAVGSDGVLPELQYEILGTVPEAEHFVHVVYRVRLSPATAVRGKQGVGVLPMRADGDRWVVAQLSVIPQLGEGTGIP